MSALIVKGNRKDLFQEISNTIQKWPDLKRKIFAKAHYQGLSPESISNSLEVDVEKVSTILRQCDRDLYVSLRGFRKGGGEEAVLIRDAS